MSMVVDVQDVFTLKQEVVTPAQVHQVDVLFMADGEGELDELMRLYMGGVEDGRIIEVPALPRYIFDDDFTVNYTALIADDGRDMSDRYPQLFE